MPIDFSSTRKPLTALSTAGLADIVLLLLIFFLLTSSFIPQFGIQVNLPKAEASAPSEGTFLTVVITDEGRFYVEQEQVSEDGLLDAVRSRRGERATLVLRADQEATVGQFARVATIAKALDMRVLMATERGALQP